MVPVWGLTLLPATQAPVSISGCGCHVPGKSVKYLASFTCSPISKICCIRAHERRILQTILKLVGAVHKSATLGVNATRSATLFSDEKDLHEPPGGILLTSRKSTGWPVFARQPAVNIQTS